MESTGKSLDFFLYFGISRYIYLNKLIDLILYLLLITLRRHVPYFYTFMHARAKDLLQPAIIIETIFLKAGDGLLYYLYGVFFL